MTVWVNLSAFARMRGISSQAVKLAIESGRLKNGARKKENGKYEVNPEVANLEWSMNTNHSMRRNVKDPTQKYIDTTPEPYVKPGVDRVQTKTSDAQESIAESRAMFERYKALLAKQEYEENAGKLVDAEAVKAEWFKLITEAKTKLLALPSKIKAVLPHLKISEVAAIERVLRETLESLSDGTD